MPVQCAKCGEELMGSVNRCWRCGQEFVARSTDVGLPPIRRRPVVSATTEVWTAELSQPIPAAEDAGVQGAAGKNQPDKRVRRGSPFGDRGTAVLEAIAPEAALREELEALELEARYHRNGGATASAALTGALGLISFIAAFYFPLAGFLLALPGLAFGIWGLKSRRRALAIAGLLLCCLSLATATFNGVVEVYVSRFGHTPWENDTFSP